MGFSKREILAEHEKHCKGIEGKPTRIEMPNERDKDTSKITKIQQKVPYVIYADFESLIQKIEGPEQKREEQENFTQNKSKHMTCGYAYNVLRGDGKVMSARRKYCRGIFERNFKGRGEHKKFIRRSSAYFHATKRLDRQKK